MKKLNFFFAFIVLGCFSTTAQNWLTTGNATTGTEFLGTNSGSLSPNLTFKRLSVFAGQLTQNCVSLGVLSWDNSTNSFKGNTYIGYEAGRFTSTDLASNTINGGNTYIGNNAGRGVDPILTGNINNNVAFNNVFVGAGSGQNNTSGNSNVFLGASAGNSNQTGDSNVFIGNASGMITTTSKNVFIGYQSGIDATGTSNIFIGPLAGMNPGSQSGPSGQRNICLGFEAGRNLTTGSYNTFIGNIELPSTNSTSLMSGTNTSNTIIFADGNNNQRFYINSNGNAGIDIGSNQIPQNRLELNSTGAVANTLGLRFRNCPTTSIVNPTNSVLSVNSAGDVILVQDKQSSNPGTLSTTCNTANFVTKSVGTNGNLTCSSIYDNGINIGFLYGAALPTNVNVSVNGTFGATGVFNTSDKKFKKDIQPIESALDKIMSLEGKTYNWRKDEFKDKNFTSELQYGLLAQDVQKVIPSLVIESENGDLAMNYTGLIPVLIEALKEQQAQISELKQQLTDNFKAQNQDLFQFSNTKIISVSPNPSNDVISISMNIEKEVQTATLQVHDINGVVLSSLNIKERTTNVTKTLQKDNFGKGVYIVSLNVNGKSIDTKKIIFN